MQTCATYRRRCPRRHDVVRVGRERLGRAWSIVVVAAGDRHAGTAAHGGRRRVRRDACGPAFLPGRAPGNGGGGPVKIMGWTCQGFATPVVLHTGKVSMWQHDRNEILEILPP